MLGLEFVVLQYLLKSYRPRRYDSMKHNSKHMSNLLHAQFNEGGIIISVVQGWVEKLEYLEFEVSLWKVCLVYVVLGCFTLWLIHTNWLSIYRGGTVDHMERRIIYLGFP